MADDKEKLPPIPNVWDASKSTSGENESSNRTTGSESPGMELDNSELNNSTSVAADTSCSAEQAQGSSIYQQPQHASNLHVPFAVQTQPVMPMFVQTPVFDGKFIPYIQVKSKIFLRRRIFDTNLKREF